MHTLPMHEVLAEAIVGCHSLSHPFYRRWEAGTLAEGELAAYVEQYRHIERELPVTLATIADALPPGHARELVEANLADELGSPEPHAELFETFASAAGAAPDAPVMPSTAALLAVVRTTASNDPVAALAMVAAYEVQAADIAARRATVCAATTGSTTRAPAFGTCIAPRKWTTQAGPWRRSRRWRPTTTRCWRPRRSRPTRGGLPQRA